MTTNKNQDPGKNVPNDPAKNDPTRIDPRTNDPSKVDPTRIAPDTNNPKIGYTGTIYAVLNSRTGTYWQLSFVNPSGLSVSKLS